MQQHSFVKFVPGIDVVYLSVPKVASSTISYALLQHASGSEEEIFEHSELGKALTNRRPVSLPYPQLPVFTFVRHPIDKFVSYYKNKFIDARATGFELVHLPKLGFDPHMSLDEVVAHMLTIPVEDMEHHAQPQTRIIYYKGRLLADFIGQMEQIEQQWQVISKLSGCDLQLAMQRNQTCTLPTNYTEQMSAQTLANLCAYYAQDFILFDYVIPELTVSPQTVPIAADAPLQQHLKIIRADIVANNQRVTELAQQLHDPTLAASYRQQMRRHWQDFLISEYRHALRKRD